MMTIPNWQAKIRAAQAASEEKIAAINAEQDAKQREMDKKDAAKLKRVLAYFGIDAEPTRNEWVQDEYEFRLEANKYSAKDKARFVINENGRVSFTLIVSRPDTCALWRDLPGYQDPYERLSETVRVEGLAENADDEALLEFRAQLAYALDNLDLKHADVVSRQRENREKRDQVPGEVYVSVETELARLIGTLVGDEVRIQMGRDD